jgi:hypothetical protein
MPCTTLSERQVFPSFDLSVDALVVTVAISLKNTTICMICHKLPNNYASGWGSTLHLLNASCKLHARESWIAGQLEVGSLDHVWAIFGPCVDHVWTVFGPCLDYIWAILGPRLDHVWAREVDLYALVHCQ